MRNLSILYFTLLVLLCTSSWQTAFAREQHIAKPAAKDLYFIENKGQIIDQQNLPRNDIDFKLQTPACNIFIGKGQLHYQWSRSVASSQSAVDSRQSPNNSLQSAVDSWQSNTQKTETYRMDVMLVNANPGAELVKEEEQLYTEHYYTSIVSNTIAHSYQKLIYKNIYPHINWVLYIKDNSLEYDFIVNEGGNPNDIQLQYGGASSLKLDDDLTTTTPFGSITENKPVCFESITNKLVAANFKLHENTVSFDIKDNYTLPLTIDPHILWATYFGGSGVEYACSMAEDTFQHIYLAGCTSSTSNIATTGAYQTVYGTGTYGTLDLFLAKYKTDGTLIWSTYYGGSGIERGASVACDPAGNIFLSGVTGTVLSYNASFSGLTTPGCHQPNYMGRDDIFLAKFDSSGQRIWGTYYGGSDVDDNAALATDDSGNVYMTGWTLSLDSIATPGAYQQHLDTGTSAANHKYDGFLVKFNGHGQRIWGTYYGGSDSERVEGIVYHNGYINLTGYTKSQNNITGTGTATSLSGDADAFVARFNEGGLLKWGTYIGGPATDEGFSIACDANDNVWIAGITNSDTNISGNNTRGGGYDAFVCKLGSGGNKQFGTYLGGAGAEEAWGICTNAYGNAYVCVHTTSSSGLPVTRAFQNSKSGTSSTTDAYLAAFAGNGDLLWGSYYGGSGDEDIHVFPGYGNANMLYSRTGTIYTCGNTASTSGIALNGHQSTNGGGTYDAYLLRLYNDTLVNILKPFTDTFKCLHDTFTVLYTTDNYFRANNTFSIQLSDSSGNFSNATIIGSKNGTNNGSITCILPPSAIPGIHYRIRILSTAPADTSANNGSNIYISEYPEPVAFSNSPTCEGQYLNLGVTSATPMTTNLWSGPKGLAGSATYITLSDIQLSDSGLYTVYSSNYGCTSSATTYVTIKPRPAKPTIINNNPICKGDTLKVSAISTTAGSTYNWLIPRGYFQDTQTIVIPNAQISDSGLYKAVAQFDDCVSLIDSIYFNVYPFPDPTIISNSPICEGDSLMLTVNDTVSNASYTWTGPGGYTSGNRDTIIKGATEALSGVYALSARVGNCVTANTATITVNTKPVKPVITGDTSICSGANLELTGNSATAGISYIWSGPNSFAANQQTVILPDVQTNAMGNYYLTIIKNGCSTLSDSFHVNVKPTPVVLALSNSPVYIGQPIMLRINAPQPEYQYQWSGPGNYVSLIDTPIIKTASLSNQGTYTVKVTQDGCSDTSSVYITVNDLPDTILGIVMYPIPNNGSFYIKGHTKYNEHIPLKVCNTLGQEIYNAEIIPDKKSFFVQVSLPMLADGIYYVRMVIDGKKMDIPFNLLR